LDAAVGFEVEFGDRLRALEDKFDRLPDGTTHIAEFYGRPSYYKCTTSSRLNQVSEEWQTTAKWFRFDMGDWQPVGAGFSSRQLVEVSHGNWPAPVDGPEQLLAVERERSRG
jgi:hypothetical protein